MGDKQKWVRFAKRRKAAFTLVEMLVAALILATSLMGFLSMMIFGGAATRRADKAGVASTLGRSFIENVRGGGYVYCSTGQFEEWYDGTGAKLNNATGAAFRVIVEIISSDEGLPHLRLKMATVEVQDSQAGGEVLFSARTYLGMGGI